MDASRLRPLGIGEILDVAIKVYRARFATLITVVAVVVAPVQFLAALISLSAEPENLPTDPEGFSAETFEVADLIGFVAATAIVGLLAVLASQFATAVSLRIVSSAYLGQEEDRKRSLAFAATKLGPLMRLLGLFFLLAAAAIAVIVVAALIAIPLGVIVGLAFLPVFIYFAVSWSLAIPPILLEEKKAWGAMKRSRELVKGRAGAVFGTLVVSMILTGIVGGVFEAILVPAVGGMDNEVASAMLTGIASTLAACLTTPFSAAVIAIVYFDLRVRKEGFDLELLAQTLGTEVPAGLDPPASGIDPGPLPRPPSI